MKQLNNRVTKISFSVLFFIISFTLCTLSFTLSVKAAPSPTPSGVVSSGLNSDVNQALDKATAFGNPFKYKDMGKLVSNGLSLGLTIASLLVLLYLLWGGIEWITSAGDKGKLENARNRITNAILGITIIAITFAIYLIIRTFLGLPVSISGLTGGSTSGTSGGGSGTATKPPWSCKSYPCDCCNMYSTEREVKCCQQIASLTSCVVGHYKNSDSECRANTSVNYQCWAENYNNFFGPGKRDPSTDACK